MIAGVRRVSPSRPGLSAVAGAACAALILVSGGGLRAQSPAPSTKLKDQIRQPWVRSGERFLRANWHLLGDIPLADAAGAIATDPFAADGGEVKLDPAGPSVPRLPDGTTLHWRSLTSWGDAIDLSDGIGLKRDLVGYAATMLHRDTAGRARLSFGSDEGARVWVNGVLVIERRGPRPLAFDEDQVEVDLQAGDNRLLVKVEQRSGPWSFAVRVLESGAIPPRWQEIAPAFGTEGSTLLVQTDRYGRRGEEPVTVRVIAAGGRPVADETAARATTVSLDSSRWPDGPYEIRCSTRQPGGLRWVTHLAWYKGDAISAARKLVDAAGKADSATPAGQTVKMLGDMVLDRLGKDGLAVQGNPWWAVHSPLMEFAELVLEAAGDGRARARAHGFYRLAWRDDVDGSPQFARAYLPIGYDPAKRTPLVLRLHGFNPANPDYVRWWGADSRHAFADAEYGQGEGLIYVEPHGRGNAQYLGLGDRDVLRVVAEAKAHFNVDEDRVYLCGDSMGGWGTWNVGTRHPDLFAALAPIYGGSDYHQYLTEEQLASLTPLARFLFEADSTQAFADALLNLPVMVLHGDADPAVNVEWSRYNVHMLQRWGYDVRYVELPGYGHEDLNRFPVIFDWFLRHRRDPNPGHVRLRSAELKNASAYWLTVDQTARPNDFMLADAEIVAPNTVRLDTQNVVALTLAPTHRLIDVTRPVHVVWNGERRTVTASAGRLELAAAGYTKDPGEKGARLAGALGEVFNVPFAIVTGTASADSVMNDVCREKTDALVRMWREWQRQPVRVFNDSELTDADAARYSLLLIGGPDANSYTRRIAHALPLRISHEEITIGGRSFPVRNGRVELIHPNPLSPGNYVLVVAATSATGMQTWPPLDLRNATYDFVVEDGHVAAAGQKADRTQLWVAGGWLNRRWQVTDDLLYAGDPAVRAAALRLRDSLGVDAIEAYVGRYQLAPDVLVSLRRHDRQLSASIAGDPERTMVPAGDDTFYIFDGPTVVTFERDPSGRVTALKGTRPDREFVGKRVD
jgi:poly(3-hydroxybutyrate) depolymerase